MRESGPIIVAGYVKSGTNLLRRLICNYVDFPKVWNHSHKRGDVVKYHWIDQVGEEGSVVLIVRHPYDTAASAYHYYARTFGDEYGHMPVTGFLHERFCQAWEMWPYSWGECVEGWVSHYGDTRICAIIKFEDLLCDRMQEATRAINALKMWPEEERIRSAVRSAFSYGSYADRSGFLNGPQREVVSDNYGEMMERLGYAC